MKNINRYGCGNGEGMFDDKEGYWVTHEDYKQLLDKYEKLALTIPVVVKQSEQFNCYEMHAYSRFAGCNKQCKECAVNEKSKAI